MKKILCIAIFSMLVIVPAAGAQATVWYVDGDVGASGAGTSWASPYKTIIEALTAAASSGDEIWVKEGTYTEGYITISSKVVDLYGGFAGTEASRSQRDWETNVTTIDGEDSIWHCITILSGAGGAIDGFTITGGNADGGSFPHDCGGGVYLDASSFTIANCTFTGNNADEDGGAIYCTATVSSASTITNCNFTGNTAANLAGAISINHGDPLISDCSFSGNSAPGGGAITINGTVTSSITGCTFAGNDATGGGGLGGAILNGGGGADPSITSCSFTGNTAAVYGGAISNTQTSATITNCTFSGNEADYGGAVDNRLSSTVTITNCILWGDSAVISGDEIRNDGSTVTVNYSDVQGGYAGTNNIDTDPFFVNTTDPDAANWDLRLQFSSPCIDQGNNTAPDIPAYDFEGEPRIYDGDADGTDTVDMGADEVYVFPQCVATSGELQAALETAETNGSHDIIMVVQGLYYGNFECLCIEGRDITLWGGYTAGCADRVLDPANTILDGAGAGTGSVLDVYSSNGGNVMVDGFTIQHGDASETGGGVRVMSVQSGAAYTGGITLTNNIIAENTATYDGGGVYAYTLTNTGEGGDITISNNTIRGNDGTFGGGVLARSATYSGTAGMVTLTNNTIFGNDATNYGGGVRASSYSDTGTAGMVILTNNTVTDNTANDGGGAHLFIDDGTDGTIECTNNIIWGNTAPTGGDIVLACAPGNTANGYFNDYASMVGTWDAEGSNINDDPLFVAVTDPDPANWDLHLRSDSPCIDAGTDCALDLPFTDFEGEPRSMDGDHDDTALPDMGADEVPTIWYVDGGISSSGTGTSWDTAKKTISEAISAASAGDEIWVKLGTYVITSVITVNKAVGLYGGFAGDETARSQRDWQTNVTTVDGDDSTNCFSVTEDAIIDGFTITQGYNTGYGGGMYIGTASPFIANCTFTDNNAATSGAAIYIYGTGSFPTIENCTFSNNTAGGSMGGAINNQLANPTISDCTFSSTNSAPYGGAIANISANVTISDCTFSGNTATSAGGAVYNNNTTGTITGCTFTGNTALALAIGGGMHNATAAPTISDCTFQGNTAWRGGGMYNSGCSPTITGCTFVGNTCDYDANGTGGGIYNDNSSSTITNCLFYDNSVTYVGGGIFNYTNSHATITNCTFYGNTSDVFGGAVGNSNSNPTFTNCILWGDTATSGGDEVHLIASGSPTFTYSDIEGGTGETWFGTGCIDINPLFVNDSDPDPGEWDLHLQGNSPCVDQGDDDPPGGLPDTDFEGDARIIFAAPDMGADEVRTLFAGKTYHLCPGLLGFGPVEATSFRRMSFTIVNPHESALEIYTITGPSPPPFTKTVDECDETTLAPGARCTITVEFSPPSEGTFSDSLTIPTNDPQAGTVTVSLVGTGVSLSEALPSGSAPSGLGETAAPESSGVSDSPGDAAPSSPPVVEDSSSHTDTAAVVTPESSTTPAAGTTSGSPAPLVISSLPAASQREEAQEPFDSMVFGEVKVGATDQLKIILSHEEGEAITMGDVVLPSAPYRIVEDKCSGTLLGGGAECAVTVQFAPQSANTFYDYFLIPTDDPEMGTLRIKLEGMGVSE